MQKIFKVYIIRDKLTEAIMYAGLTRQTLETRFHSHVKHKNLNRNKYQIELIQDDLTLEQAVILERMLIEQYQLLITGWNKSPGSINGYSNYHSEEQKQKWSEERKGKKVNPLHAQKNTIARLGKKNSEAHTDAIIKAIQKPVICIETGIIYKSARAAAKDLNLCYSKISLVCNGKRSTTGNLHFKFVETVEISRND